MSRLSRAMKREQKRAASAEGSAAQAPIDVRVPVAGPGASIGGVPVTAAPGEEIQRAVLTHLHRIAVAAGHPVHAMVHDERIGYVVPLCVEQDGSSRYTAEPLRTEPAHVPDTPGVPVPPASSVVEPEEDRATRVLRPRRAPEPDAPPTFRLRTVSRRTDGAAPGTVAAPLGEFGPPPVMDGYGAAPDAGSTDAPAPDARTSDAPASDARVSDAPAPDVRASDVRVAPEPRPLPTASAVPDPESLPVSAPEPAPPRGFDAVAESVLDDDAQPQPGAAADVSPFAGPMARVHDAVRAGRTAEAAELVGRAVAEAAALMGVDHPEVLRMRELDAYIAYLAGEPESAFALALDVAWAYRRTGDAEASYSSLQGAATAWRAVRDPALGQELGRNLLGLWNDLVAEGVPTAEEAEELESARARMDRLAARAARADGATGA
ncbi:tetratricopeptide repeat protein [Streptomyces sp. RK62]|uniref:tetratricopeptide repeat protein n=1 Tax=Streptomyces sp. RK62 TaxID=2824893 RepID=UPI001B394CA3|nr:tetratricopeptide repeat protein [Streptomyces sp. RK62]MBQ0996981.1 tetratricopeptide repeat protein [Streptomyces sp. RK62]